MNFKLNLEEIRNLFIKYFIKNDHIFIKGSSIIPHNDSSILFVNSGMNQFKDILLGKKKINFNKIVTVQKCIRAGGKNDDLNNVGFSSSHHTFFEMLGNFSFNNYYKSETIELAFNLITNNNWFGIPKEKLLITVHSMDDESYKIWIKLGIKDNKILKIGSNKNFLLSNNFWRMGDYGPCGPCTEIFYIDKIISNKLNFNNLIINGIEIWNLVFMQFDYTKDNELINLPFNSVDTGMGLERISMVLQGVKTSYEIDIFINIKKIIYKFTLLKNKNIEINIISDHIRSILFIISEGILPSNEGKGYVLRKIIRRSICYGIILNIKEKFLYKLVTYIIDIMKFYKNNFNNINFITNIIYNEEVKFNKVINSCLNILNKKLINKNNILSGEFVFKMHDTYGLPFFLLEYIISNKNITYNKNEFEYFMKLQKSKSKIKNKI